MSRTVAEIKTRFTLVGLRTAATELRAFASRMAAAVQRVSAAANRAGRSLREAFGTRTKAAILSATATLNRFSRSLTRLGFKAAVISAAIVAGFIAISAAAKAASVAIAGVIGLAGGAAIVAGSVALANNTALTQAEAARTTGASNANAAGAAAAGKAFGFDGGEVEAALGGLRTGEAQAALRSIGIEARDSSGKLRDTVDVLGDLDRKFVGMSDERRGEILKTLFGDESDKLDSFLKGGGAKRARDLSALATAFGAVATERDLRNARDWRESVQKLILAFRGLALSISRQILPVITKAVDGLSAFIAANREAIAGRVVQGWNKVMRAMREAVGALRIVPIVGRAIVRSMYTMLDVFADIGRYLGGDYVNMRRSWVYELMRMLHATIATVSALADNLGGGVMRLISRTWIGFLHIVVQIVAAFRGLDHVVSARWILVLRDGVMAVLDFLKALPARIDYAVRWTQALFNMIVAYARVVVAAVPVVLDQAKEAVIAWANSLKAAVLQALHDWIIAPVRHLVTVIKEIWAVLAQGGDATVTTAFVAGIRDELLAVREVAVTLIESFKTAWGWFMALHRAIVSVFGEDVTATLMFFGLLRVTGLLNIILGGIRLVGAAFVKLWALGKAGILTAALAKITGALTSMFAAVQVGTAATLSATAGGVAGAFATAIGAIKAGFVGLLTAVTGAAATAGATVMAFLARIPQLLAVILAVRVGTQVGEYAAKGLDWATGGRLSGRRALEQTANDNRARMDRSYDERVARLAARPKMPEPVRVGTAGTAQINAANVFSEYDFWGQSGSGTKEQVDVNFNVGGRHAGRLSGDRTAVDELTRALTDARAAGGLR